jgi:hypothetical protein
MKPKLAPDEQGNSRAIRELRGGVFIAPRPEITAHGGTYQGLSRMRDSRDRIIFPDTCPACGSPAVRGSDGPQSSASVQYHCGGEYVPLPQIDQGIPLCMLTDRWWGSCPESAGQFVMELFSKQAA